LRTKDASAFQESAAWSSRLRNEACRTTGRFDHPRQGPILIEVASWRQAARSHRIREARMKTFAWIAVALAAGGAASQAGAQQALGIGTSPQGTLTYQIGAAYGQAVNDALGRQARVQPQSGTGVMVPLVNSGELDIGFVNTLEMTDAYTGTGTFDGRSQDDIRMVGVMFPIRVGMFVRDESDMQTVEDLKGKRLAWAYTSQQIIQTVLTGVLANAGLGPEDVQHVLVPNLIRGVDEFIAGNVDAGFFAIGPAKVAEADAAVDGIRFLPMSESLDAVARMQQAVPSSYIATVQPTAATTGVDQPLPTMHYNYTMFVNADLPDDLVSDLTGVLAEKSAQMAESVPLFRQLDPKQLWRDFGVPYHPGAIRYYEEKGIEQTKLGD
jgi:TRAP transporter TAXI family solute receptor